MGLGITDVRGPVVNITALKGLLPEGARTLRERLLRLDYEESTKRRDVLHLEFDNSDGMLLSKESVGFGVEFMVQWGYPSLLGPMRHVYVKKIGGQAGQRRTSGGRRPVRQSLGGFGKVSFECWTEAAPLYFFQATDDTTAGRPAPRSFTGVTMAAAIREIAYAYGFRDAQIYIEAAPEDVTWETIVIPLNRTHEQWLRDQANHSRHVFFIDETGFHWHSVAYDRSPVENLSYFAGEPDVQAFSVTGDLTLGEGGRVTAAGRDLEAATTVAVDQSSLVGPDADSNTGESGRQQAPGGEFTAGLITLDDRAQPRREHERITTANPRMRGAMSARARIESQIERKWKLRVELVGNPRVRARRWIRLSNFGELIDDDWYARKVTHSVQAGGVYRTVIEEATREAPSAGASRRPRPGDTEWVAPTVPNMDGDQEVGIPQTLLGLVDGVEEDARRGRRHH